jgi:peptidoglycan/xylan/chitin deacetylase (PgdA/CDA1 family)
MRIDFDRVERSDGDFHWPNGARLAVVLTSEYEPVYQLKPLAGGQPNYRQLAEIRYEATRGIWRVLNLLAEHKARCTYFVNGATAERFPESVKAIVAGGHEVGAHSWHAADHFTMSREEEDAVIGRTAAALTKAAGTRPSGWLTPRAQVSENTVELMVKHGFTWHSDCFDDDLPYSIEVDGKTLIEIPRSTLTDDYAMLGNLTARPFGSPRDMLDVWIDEFDVLYKESKGGARLFSVNWHHCMMGRPAISRVLDELLTHVNKHEGVWCARGVDVAEFWSRRQAKGSRASH